MSNLKGAGQVEGEEGTKDTDKGLAEITLICSVLPKGGDCELKCINEDNWLQTSDALIPPVLLSREQKVNTAEVLRANQVLLGPVWKYVHF